MKKFKVTVDDGFDSCWHREIKAKDKTAAIVEFLFWQLRGVSIEEMKTKKKAKRIK